MSERVTGERLEAYMRACHALAYFPVEPWPGGHRGFYRAAYEFAKANGYQRRDLVEQLYESLTVEQREGVGIPKSDKGSPGARLGRNREEAEL